MHVDRMVPLLHSLVYVSDFSSCFSFRRYVLESLSGLLRELKNKGKDQLVIPKSGRGRLWEQSLTRACDYRV